MSVEIQVPTVLRPHTGGERVVHVEGDTVSAAIASLESRFPGLRTELLNDDGQVRQFVNIYVNDEDIRYLNRLDTKLADGDRMAILPAVAGGQYRVTDNLEGQAGVR
ncbi:MAG: MoaD family protein [Chloroflexi bacterium]|nr:MoaD family protein [Chloroflexota bacterium]